MISPVARLHLIEPIPLSLIPYITVGRPKVMVNPRFGVRARFSPERFLAETGVGRTLVEIPKNKTIFSQGDHCTAVFFIQSGKVKLTVLSKKGKEATIALLNAKNFVGEECVTATAPARMATAKAVTDCSVLRIERKEMLRVLHQEHAFSDLFVAYLLGRNVRIQEDLIDQLFNSSEKRLARTFLLLAQFGKPGTPERSSIRSGNAGRDGGYNPFPRQLLPKSLSRTRLH